MTKLSRLCIYMYMCRSQFFSHKESVRHWYLIIYVTNMQFTEFLQCPDVKIQVKFSMPTILLDFMYYFPGDWANSPGQSFGHQPGWLWDQKFNSVQYYLYSTKWHNLITDNIKCGFYFLVTGKNCVVFYSQFKMPRGSTTTLCINCKAVIAVATKTCKSCQAVQPRKQRLAKKLKIFEAKKEGWVKNQKKNKTTSHVMDESSVLVCV